MNVGTSGRNQMCLHVHALVFAFDALIRGGGRTGCRRASATFNRSDSEYGRSDQPSLLSLVGYGRFSLGRILNGVDVVLLTTETLSLSLRQQANADQQNSGGAIRGRGLLPPPPSPGVYTGDALLSFPPFHQPSEPSTCLIAGRRRTYLVTLCVRSASITVTMQIMVGDLGAILGVLLYRLAFSPHRFRRPHIVAIGYLTFNRHCVVSLNDKRESDHHRGENEEVDREMTVTVA